MDDLDRRILSLVQDGFPLVQRPFHELGEMLGVREEEILERISCLQSEGLIRRIGPIIDTRRLGLKGMLVALPVPPDKLEFVSQLVNSYEEVSHNYLRPNETPYNMWFTLSSKDPRIREILEEIRSITGLEPLVLEAKRVFKIGVRFDIA